MNFVIPLLKIHNCWFPGIQIDMLQWEDVSTTSENTDGFVYMKPCHIVQLRVFASSIVSPYNFRARRTTDSIWHRYPTETVHLFQGRIYCRSPMHLLGECRYTRFMVWTAIVHATTNVGHTHICQTLISVTTYLTSVELCNLRVLSVLNQHQWQSCYPLSASFQGLG